MNGGLPSRLRWWLFGSLPGVLLIAGAVGFFVGLLSVWLS